MPKRSSFLIVVLCTLVLTAGRTGGAAAPASPASAPSATPAVAPGLVEFSPRGTVKQVRQAVARFATPMVAYGDPRAVDPLVADCPVAGTGRWLDARTWVYDFVRTLPGGVRCTFRARPDLKDLAGAALRPIEDLGFDTGGPAIVSSIPSADETIDAEQAFVLRLDAEPAAESVERHAYFAVDGVAERVGVRIVDGAERAQLLERFGSGEKDAVELVLAARRRFPDGAGVRLVWGAGVATASGVATTEDQTLDFTVRPTFTAELRCQRETARTDCIPLTPIVVRFSAPVPWSEASRITLTAPDGKAYAAVPPDSPDLAVSQVVFRGPFPPSTTLRLEVPTDLKDDAGRTLANAAQMQSLQVALGADPPLAKFASRFAIVELEADPALPVTIRNLGARVTTRELRIPPDTSAATGASADVKQPSATVSGEVLRVDARRASEILAWLRKVGSARRDRSVFRDAKLPAGEHVQSLSLPELSGEELQVVGIPLPKPGLYVVEIESLRLGEALLEKPKLLYVPAAALVTDMAVHFEWSASGSVVWVTRLSDARPVEGAKVAVHDCAGRVLAEAETDAQGIARIADLPDRDDAPLCRSSNDEYDEHHDYRASRALSDLDGGLFVTARHGDDLSFVHSSWDFGIEPYRFDLPQEPWNGPYVAHTIFDRPLLRAGETVHMKHVYREQTLQGFAVVDPARAPTKLSIRHLGSDTRYDLPLEWRSDGSAVTDWPIPKEAKLGLYEVYYVREGAPADAPTPTPPAPYVRLAAPEPTWDREWLAGTFRVAEFRVPLARGTVKLPAEPLVAPSAVQADLAVQYLAGGGAGDLPVVLRAQLEPYDVRVKDLPDASFANGPVKVGIRRDGDDGPDDDERAEGKVLSRQELRLDAAGTARATIGDLPAVQRPERLRAELEFRDPNGEVQTAVASVPLWPSGVVAGVEVKVREAHAPRLATRAVVLDDRLQPAPRVRVQIDAFERRNYSVRKRLVGGFYAYDYVEDTRPLGTLCRGRTRADGTLRCERLAKVSGNVVVQVTAWDESGRASVAHQDVWVAGEDDFWFRVGSSDRMDVLPDRKRYEPGDVARLQVRMPFRQATALVTTAREGVLDARVVELSGKDPTIEVPVTDAFSPNMFVSVLAVRGRVGDVQPTARVDLGKPSFKLGIAELVVGWKPHELDVDVTTDREVYRVRETAKARISVRAATGEALPPGATVALAAVDEGLLELAPNESWHLLRAMMGRRGFGVWTSTGQMEVVGKRHYGRKARPQGGGGGRSSTRELFDTLLLWRADVPLDASGAAEVEIPLNDSLTSFRIVAVATAGTGLFGDGGTTIRTTQDLLLLSGLPPVVRSGDRFRAELTVRNTTERTLDVALRAKVEGLADELAGQTLALAPGEAKIASWEVTVPDGVTQLVYDFAAQAGAGEGADAGAAAGAGEAADSLRVVQLVVPAVPVRVVQGTLVQLAAGAPFREPVAAPAGALPGQGGINLKFTPSLLSGLDGPRAYMERYPYTCLEQRVSRAVVLDDSALWSQVVAALPAHFDDDGFLTFFPGMRDGSELLTAYVLLISRTAGYALPDDVVEKMERALRGFVDGTVSPGDGVQRGAVDLPLRKLAVLAALATDGDLDPTLLDGIPIEPNLWPASTLLDWWTILARTPSIERRDARLAEAQQALRARLELGGTTLGFRDDGANASWSIFSGGDVDALRLVLLALDAPSWRGDVPRLMRGALARQERGRWDTTIANAWGALATRAFARSFESEPVTGEAVAALAGASGRVDWGREPEGGSVALPWPKGQADLTIEQRGGGKPWASVLASAAVPLEKPLEAGYRIVKHIAPLEPRPDGTVRAGDVLLVRLEIDAQAERPWVVVDDPVPAGSSHLRKAPPAAAAPGATPDASSADASLSPTFVERSFQSWKGYFEWLPAGKTVLTYAIRVNQPGRFLLPPTRVEALYAPESFGETPNAPLEVAP